MRFTPQTRVVGISGHNKLAIEMRVLQRQGVIGNPTQLVPEYDEPSARKVNCSAYNACSTFARQHQWRVWTCNGCRGRPGVQNGYRGGNS